MAEEADVQDSEITLEDFNADEKQDSPKEPSPKEAKAETKPEVAKSEEPEAKLDAKASAEPPADKTETEGKKADVADDTAETAPDETEIKPLGEEKPLAPKSENRFQKLANENRQLRDQVEKLTSETYAPQSVQELTQAVNPETGEPYTVAQATDIALSQQLQMRDYNNRITQAQTVIGTEAYEIMQELPIFNPSSDQFDKELAGIAAETLEANLVRDPNIPEIDPKTGQPTGLGIVVDYKQSPKQIYQTLARASGLSAAKGELKGQQNTEKQLANVDAASSAAPEKKPEDPLMALWKSDD